MGSPGTRVGLHGPQGFESLTLCHHGTARHGTARYGCTTWATVERHHGRFGAAPHRTAAPPHPPASPANCWPICNRAVDLLYSAGRRLPASPAMLDLTSSRRPDTLRRLTANTRSCEQSFVRTVVRPRRAPPVARRTRPAIIKTSPQGAAGKGSRNAQSFVRPDSDLLPRSGSSQRRPGSSVRSGCHRDRRPLDLAPHGDNHGSGRDPGASEPEDPAGLTARPGPYGGRAPPPPDQTKEEA